MPVLTTERPKTKRRIQDQSIPFFSMFGIGNTCQFEQKVTVHNEEGFHEAILKGFARVESLIDVWRYKKPEWCDIWCLYYKIWRIKFYVPFGKVIRALSVKDRDGIKSVFVLTRSAHTQEERKIHERHPFIGDARFPVD